MGRGNEHRDRRRQFGARSTDSWGDNGLSPSYAQPPHQEASSFGYGSEAEARVKWFNSDKGFGFVELTDGSGEAFLHIRQVEAAGHSALEPGTTLLVTVGTGQKGPQVTNVLSVDASTATVEPPRRATPSRAGQSGGIPRQGASRPEPNAATVPGTVKWFDPAKGYGFVTVEGESKDLFLHISVVERAGLGALAQGQTVRVAIVEGRKGREVGAIEAT
ncbi:cold-shock protein [Microvirga sp. TS319]|uniref:cold-shock protein n=1 Tax=Microvirga sp. TS319 TaxID=3241165 RepID=UPI00351A081C